MRKRSLHVLAICFISPAVHGLQLVLGVECGMRSRPPQTKEDFFMKFRSTLQFRFRVVWDDYDTPSCAPLSGRMTKNLTEYVEKFETLPLSAPALFPALILFRVKSCEVDNDDVSFLHYSSSLTKLLRRKPQRSGWAVLQSSNFYHSSSMVAMMMFIPM